jgi:hypothetical protein
MKNKYWLKLIIGVGSLLSLSLVADSSVAESSQRCSYQRAGQPEVVDNTCQLNRSGSDDQDGLDGDVWTIQWSDGYSTRINFNTRQIVSTDYTGSAITGNASVDGVLYQYSGSERYGGDEYTLTHQNQSGGVHRIWFRISITD